MPAAVSNHRVVSAFSLIEVMVTVGLLSFIILGLLAMFSQTQKAFRAGMTQTDVLEAGRSVMEMLTREIEQTSPTKYDARHYGATMILATNFFIETTSDLANLLIQDLPVSGGTPPKRYNFHQRLFFYTKVNQDWIGVGYQVVPSDAGGWVGTLYRYAATNNSRIGPFTNATTAFRFAALTNMNRIADGIVHFRIRPYSAAGYPIIADPNTANGITSLAHVRTNSVVPVGGPTLLQYAPVKDTFSVTDSRAPDRMLGCYFVRDAIPAYVEVELGILEPQLMARYRSIPVATAARQFLSDHVAQVHIFRQRIPLRNVDSSVFP